VSRARLSAPQTYQKMRINELCRTAALVLVSGVNTFVQSWVTIEGVEALGAAAYAGIWVVAPAISGVALGIVGAV